MSKLIPPRYIITNISFAQSGWQKAELIIRDISNQKFYNRSVPMIPGDFHSGGLTEMAISRIIGEVSPGLKGWEKDPENYRTFRDFLKSF